MDERDNSIRSVHHGLSLTPSPASVCEGTLSIMQDAAAEPDQPQLLEPHRKLFGHSAADDDPCRQSAEDSPPRGWVRRPRSSAIVSVGQELASMLTSSDLLLGDLDRLSPAQVRERLEANHRSSFLLHALVEDLLWAEAMQDGLSELRCRPLDLADLVSEVATVLTPILRKKGQCLETSSEALNPKVCADPRRLGQALVDLILTAAERTRENVPIEIEFAVDGASVRVVVKDLDRGIREECEQRLSDDLGELLPAHSQQGLRLGVATSIVRAHGGRAGAENQPDGEALWFELPAMLEL